jgi:nucleotide-binding universal stress UspA family protein
METGVLVGYDQSPCSELAVDEAAAEAVRRGVGLTVVHAFRGTASASPPHEVPAGEAVCRSARSIAERGAARAVAGHPDLAVTALALPGPAATVLAGRSSDAELLVVGHRGHDLVVVGAHRHGGGRQGVRVGPIAHTLLMHSDCSVAVVPHD